VFGGRGEFELIYKRAGKKNAAFWEHTLILPTATDDANFPLLLMG